MTIAHKAHRVPASYLESFMKEAFTAIGIPAEDARVCAEVLIESDLRGIESHGIGRFKPIYIDRIEAGQILPTTKLDLVRETPTTAVFDANNGMGQVASRKAMEVAIAKAKTFGLGMTAVRNSNHYGIAGYYATMATDQGLIGLTGTNARPSIAPTFGVENMLGTNPLVFGIPTDEEFPFVIDCATSVSQRGKIEVYERLGKQLPPGWVIGEDGSIRTDTVQVLKDLVKGTAALTTLGGVGEEGGGHKGYGYATVVEILSSALQGGAFLKGLLGFDAEGKRQPYALGHFFMAINVDAFTDQASFRKTTGEILRQLRASKKMPGHDRIYTAGEKEHLSRVDRLANGIPVDETLQAHINDLRKKHSIGGFKFPWD